MNRRIKSLMAFRGITNREMAREIGISETWFSLVVHGHRNSDRIRKEVAKRLGVKASDLWPDDDHGRGVA